MVREYWQCILPSNFSINLVKFCYFFHTFSFYLNLQLANCWLIFLGIKQTTWISYQSFLIFTCNQLGIQYKLLLITVHKHLCTWLSWDCDIQNFLSYQQKRKWSSFTQGAEAWKFNSCHATCWWWRGHWWSSQVLILIDLLHDLFYRSQLEIVTGNSSIEFFEFVNF